MRNGDQDYNYIINLEKYGGAGGSGSGGPNSNNPLLASVHTQGSLKGNNETTTNGTATAGGNRGKIGNAGSGVSQGSHGGSGINISKKDTK